MSNDIMDSGNMFDPRPRSGMAETYVHDFIMKGIRAGEFEPDPDTENDITIAWIGIHMDESGELFVSNEAHCLRGEGPSDHYLTQDHPFPVAIAAVMAGEVDHIRVL